MGAPTDWAAIELCIDADLREHETDVLQWTGSEGSAAKWRRRAKKLIEERLKSMQKIQELDLKTEEDEVLNLIGNPEVLRTAAIYRTLHLIANDQSQGVGDLYDRKAELYLGLFEEELPRALLRMDWDVDESGTIEDEEKYIGAKYTGVRIIHGG